MAAALLHLTQQPPPSSVVIPGLLDGMASVNRLAPEKWLAPVNAARTSRGVPLAALDSMARLRLRPTRSRRLCSQGLSAPLRDLYRPGNPRAGTAWPGHRDRLAAPPDRSHHPPDTRGDPRLRYFTCRNISRTSRGGCWRPGAKRGVCRAIARFAGRGFADLVRDPTPNRVRRFGQALVLAAELAPDIRHLHAHFLHTPASVARYAAAISRAAVVRVGACQRHLDDAGLGKARQAGRGGLGGNLHRDRPGAPRRALAPSPGCVSRSAITGSTSTASRRPAPKRSTNDGSDPGASGDPAVRSAAPSPRRVTTTCSPRWPAAARARLAAGAYRWRRLGKAAAGTKRAVSVWTVASNGAGAPQPEVLAAYREADLFVLAAKIDRVMTTGTACPMC